MLVHPTWNSVDYQKDIIRTLEEEVGIDVYSEDESFEEMLAQLEAEAEAVRKWGDEASITTVADETGGVCSGIAGPWLGAAVSTKTRTG